MTWIAWRPVHTPDTRSWITEVATPRLLALVPLPVSVLSWMTLVSPGCGDGCAPAIAATPRIASPTRSAAARARRKVRRCDVIGTRLTCRNIAEHAAF